MTNQSQTTTTSKINSDEMQIKMSVQWASEEFLEKLENECGYKFINIDTDFSGDRWYIFMGKPISSIPGTFEHYKYKSVTTVVGEIMGNDDYLENWKASVGVEFAEKRSRVAAGRGTELHSILEKLFKGEKIHKLKVLPAVALQLKGMIAHLNDTLGMIYFSEHPVMSIDYKCAGRLDLCADYNMKLSVIDFKTTNMPMDKFYEFSIAHPDMTKKWLLQCYLYSRCLKFMYAFDVDQYVVLVAHPDGKITELLFNEVQGNALYNIRAPDR